MQTILLEYNKVLSERFYAPRAIGDKPEDQIIGLATAGLQLMGVEYEVVGNAGNRRITITAASIAAIPAIENLLYELATARRRAVHVLATVNAVLASGYKQPVKASPANALVKEFGSKYTYPNRPVVSYNEAAIAAADVSTLIDIAMRWQAPLMSAADPEVRRERMAEFNALITALKYYRDEWRPTAEPSYYAQYQELSQRYELIKKALQ